MTATTATIPAIDAHHHFWTADVDAGWMQGAYAPLRRQALPADVQAGLDAANVVGVVAVQADDTAAETALLQRLAADPASRVIGVVGWLPLTEPEHLAARLAAVRAAGPLHGVRHQSHLEADPEWLLSPAVVESVTELGRAGVVVDLVSIGTEQTQRCVELAERVPGTVFVLDHLGKPDIAGGQWDDWAAQMSRLAAAPNARAKVSGLDTCATWQTWTAADIARYVEHVVECFGPQRTLAGSDWPVASLASDYPKVWSELRTVLAAMGDDVARAVLHDTAQATYGLGAA